MTTTTMKEQEAASWMVGAALAAFNSWPRRYYYCTSRLPFSFGFQLLLVCFDCGFSCCCRGRAQLMIPHEGGC